MTVSKLDQRIPVDAFPIEMADLAATLNQMLNRLQEAFNRLSEFSSDLAHELRTPLSNLMTQTQVALSQERSNHEYHEILASNIEELQRLAQTVSDMLFLAKAENGLDLPTRKLFSVKDEIAILFEFYNILAAEKSIVLEFFGNAQVMGDGPMFRRAISNLLSNAFRFTPNFGKIMVEVESTAKTVTVHVENTGDNINEKLLPFLFDRFFRADKSRPHLSSDGTGLGLSITRAIVEAHGGKISVISAQGKTRFSLLFMRNTP